MKRQNGVVLCGKLANLRAAEVKSGPLSGPYVVATLITDHAAYGGHHWVLFPAEHAPDALAYWALTGGDLEVSVEGWLRSMPSGDGSPPSGVVVVDRVIYLTATSAMRDQVGRHRSSERGGKPGSNRAGAQRAP